MVAPTPVSALLHAVAVVKAGVFTILKVVVYVFGIDLVRDLDAHTILAYVAGFTVVAASVIALGKDNLKERLAYSTIGQLSYIVLGALVAMPRTIEGAGLHIATHATGKITLFFGAGAILVAAHKKKVSQLDGIGRRMAVTNAAKRLISLASVVDISAQTLPGPSAPSSPSSASITAAEAAGEGRQVITMSERAASSAGLSAHAAPCARNGSAALRSRSRTVSSNPFRSRLPASLAPTLPSPTNPIFIADSPVACGAQFRGSH